MHFPGYLSDMKLRVTGVGRGKRQPWAKEEEGVVAVTLNKVLAREEISIPSEWFFSLVMEGKVMEGWALPHCINSTPAKRSQLSSNHTGLFWKRSSCYRVWSSALPADFHSHNPLVNQEVPALRSLFILCVYNYISEVVHMLCARFTCHLKLFDMGWVSPPIIISSSTNHQSSPYFGFQIA